MTSNLESFHATLTADKLAAVLEEAGGFWEQACIRFELESVVEDPLTVEQESEFQQNSTGPLAQEDHYPLMRAAMPTTQLLSPGWNVMVFPYFAVAPTSGVYMPEIRSMLWAEQLPPSAPPGENPPIILAHELGHSFGLLHYTGADAEQNLMNQGVMQLRDRAHRLTTEQIEMARAQVRSGDTYLPQ